MVVDVLASDDGVHGGSLLALDPDLLILELGLLGSQAGLVVIGAVVLVRAVLDRDDVVVVLLGESLIVGDGLD